MNIINNGSTKLTIKTDHYDNGCSCGTRQAFYINGEKIGVGHYGGEPEDNSYNRDYSWVDSTIEAIAKKLGAEIENINVSGLTAEEQEEIFD